MLSEKQTARRDGRRSPIGLILLAALIVVPMAEIAVLIEVGGRIGVGATLALIVLTAMLGAWMLRRQGLAVLRRAQQQMRDGALPVGEVFEGFCLVVAGALLLTPGFLSDAVGALLLLPPARAWLYRRVRHRLEDRLRSGAAPHPGAAGRDRDRPPDEPPVIDAEFEELEPMPEPRDMPEPRGGWNRRS